MRIHDIYALEQAIQQKSQAKDNKKLQLIGSNDSLLFTVLFRLYSEKPKKIFLLLPHLKDLTIWQNKLELLLKNLSPTPVELQQLPHTAVWGGEKYLSRNDSKKKRLMAYGSLLKPDVSTVVLCTLQGLAQYFIPKNSFLQKKLRLHKDSSYDLDQLTQQLIELGFDKAFKVEDKAQFSIRGGIVDIFPLSEKKPVRLEFFADELHSIRYFSPQTQRSEDEIDLIDLICCHDFNLDPQKSQLIYNFLMEHNAAPQETQGLLHALEHGERVPRLDAFSPLFYDEKQCVLDILDNQAIVLFPQTIAKCEESFELFQQHCEFLWAKDKEAHHPSFGFADYFSSLEILQPLMARHLSLEFGNPILPSEAINHPQVLEYANLYQEPSKNLQLNQQSNPVHNLDTLQQLWSSGTKLVFLLDQIERLENLQHVFQARDVPVSMSNPLVSLPSASETKIHGFLCPSEDFLWDQRQKTLYVPYTSVFGKKHKTKVTAQKKLKKFLDSFHDLKTQDYVVHVQHGVGSYLGTSQLAIENSRAEFIVIAYKGGDKLYLPVHKISELQKYKSAHGQGQVSLDKLGGQTFVLKKAKLSRDIKDYADELLKIHAKRSIAKPFLYAPPSKDYLDFVEDFPFEETADQARAIDEIEQDLMSHRLMDRLIVGDVGFGKTEVALRAVMRAILEGFQVLFLVPTTILCYQHFESFKFRLEKFGVKIAHLSRLVKKKDQEAILQDLEQGRIDFVIGTHRLLSKDIRPKKLGLLIIDEEQKFGVTHKEKLKRLKSQVDILTLSATPIPRTLHMAVIGLKDISLIATPPQNRIPVKTIVSHYDQDMVKMALESELMRGGQVFFVHNRVDEIEPLCKSLQQLVPQAKIRGAHGQMHEENLETLMIDFLEQKFHVLVCTTIIESGVDMPNVNTIIVNQAHMYGLSQLHQLRGRVGRASLQAYAYFLVKNPKHLSDEALQRLEVLSTHQELGAGFHVAQYDMEIRGVGNLIGMEQSGNISSVGLDMYAEMLETAIKELSHEKVTHTIDPEIKLKITALIPIPYIQDERERVSLYRQLFAATQEDEIWAIAHSTQDRFGANPIEFQKLLKIAMIRLKLISMKVRLLLALTPSSIELRWSQIDAQESQMLHKLCHSHQQVYQWYPQELKLLLKLSSQGLLKDEQSQLAEILNLIEPICVLFSEK